MTRIAFTADLHADDFGQKLDPETGLNARWVDTIDMVRWVAADARARKADVLVVGGDFTEGRHPAPWRVAQILQALDAFDGPTVLARGNHDGLRAGRSIVDVLASGRPGWVGFSRPGVTVTADVAIAVLPFLDAHWLRAQPGFDSVPEAEVLRVLAQQYLVIAGGLYAEAAALAPRSILVVHQGLSGGLMSDTQRAFLGDKTLVVDGRALGAIGFDAVLAGHFHLHQVLQADPLVAYAGAPYRTDFGEEHQAKGYMVVDVDAAGVRWEFVETPARRFVTVDASAWPEDPEHGGPDSRILRDAVVRVVNLPPEDDVADVRRALEENGAWDVQEIRRRPVTPAESVGGLSESLTATEALLEYFVGDVDVDALVDRGRAVLAEVA